MSDPSDDFSRAFYPFLHAEKKKPQDLMQDLKFSLQAKTKESINIKERFFADHQDTILQVSLAIAKAYSQNKKLLVCGNGGSATDAQHIAVEFMHPITVGRKALPAICLANDVAMITAVANDVGIDDIFARQIIALGSANDLLIALSTSGNSANLINAFITARKMAITTIALTGNDGGKLLAMYHNGEIDFCLNVATDSVHRIQETHVTLYHIIWDMVHTILQNGSLL